MPNSNLNLKHISHAGVLSIEGALDAWMPRLLVSLKALFPSIPSSSLTSDSLPSPRVNIASTSESRLDNQSSNDISTQQTESCTATVKCNRRITASDWYQDVRHIEFDLEANIAYDPGDVAVIHPKIPDNNVRAFLDMVGWENEADEIIRVEPNDNGELSFYSACPFCLMMPLQGLPISANVPQRTSLRQLFTEHLNFQAVPRRSFFDIIRHFAQEEREAERLAEFCGPQGAVRRYLLRCSRLMLRVFTGRDV